MNAFQLAASEAAAANLPINRFGGDATSRYNYQLDVTSSASDWYFENHTGATGVQDTSEFKPTGPGPSAPFPSTDGSPRTAPPVAFR